MTTLLFVTKRNIKLFFKDKGLFFVSLITPAILLILYITFLGNVYRNIFVDALRAADPDFVIDEKTLGSLVGGQMISSLLAVCCVTVSFCSNMVMAQDKASGAAADFAVSPVKKSTLALGYYIATFFNTMVIALFALAASFVYLAAAGWMLNTADVFLILIDVTLLVMFGTAMSSIVNFFLSTQAQISAVGSIVSSMYGFICGAYMPISQFPEWLQSVLMFLPGTYGTALLRNHCMRGPFEALQSAGVDIQIVDRLKASIDCDIFIHGASQPVSQTAMFAVLGITTLALIAVYVIINISLKRKNR